MNAPGFVVKLVLGESWKVVGCEGSKPDRPNTAPFDSVAVAVNPWPYIKGNIIITKMVKLTQQSCTFELSNVLILKLEAVGQSTERSMVVLTKGSSVNPRNSRVRSGPVEDGTVSCKVSLKNATAVEEDAIKLDCEVVPIVWLLTIYYDRGERASV